MSSGSESYFAVPPNPTRWHPGYVPCLFGTSNLTGVQRASKESIFSGLNNIVVDTALNSRFAEGCLVDGVFGYRFPKSNHERGDGIPDVVLEPERENEGTLPAIVLEVKFGRDVDAEALDTLAQTALGQIVDKSYAHGLCGTDTLMWGIAFNGKHAAALCERI